MLKNIYKLGSVSVSELITNAPRRIAIFHEITEAHLSNLILQGKKYTQLNNLKNLLIFNHIKWNQTNCNLLITKLLQKFLTLQVIIDNVFYL